MQRKRIIHSTTYRYHTPVHFGTHRALMRPREGHDLKIVNTRVEVEPAASVRWLRDIEGNSVAILTFSEPASCLRLLSEIDVELNDDPAIECLIDPSARSFPFQYSPDEQVDLIPYRLPSYQYEGPVLNDWLCDLYRPGQLVDTFDLLRQLNSHIFHSLRYSARDSRCPTAT